MSTPDFTRRIAVLLLLFCLPFQLVSATAIDCLHADNNSPGMPSSHCHTAVQVADTVTDSSANLTQCQKCALDLLLLASIPTIHQQPVSLIIPVFEQPQTESDPLELFIPPLQRPPLVSGLL